MCNMSCGNEKANELLVQVRVCPDLKIQSAPLRLSELGDFREIGLNLPRLAREGATWLRRNLKRGKGTESPLQEFKGNGK